MAHVVGPSVKPRIRGRCTGTFNAKALDHRNGLSAVELRPRAAGDARIRFDSGAHSGTAPRIPALRQRLHQVRRDE